MSKKTRFWIAVAVLAAGTGGLLGPDVVSALLAIVNGAP